MLVKVEAGTHWYKPGEADRSSFRGEPAYGSTLREARKEHLLPSVTTVLKEKSNFQLQSWREEQKILAALTLPDIPGETVDEKVKRIISDADAQSKTARETGDVVHKLVERILLGENPTFLSEYSHVIREGVKGAIKVFYEHKAVTEHVESMFVNIGMGYGCRIDWGGKLLGINSLVDVKTQGNKPGKKMVKYPEWCWQLAANSMAMPTMVSRHVNIAVSTTEPGYVEVFDWEPEEILNGWHVFTHLLKVFTLSRKMGEWDGEKRQYVGGK